MNNKFERKYDALSNEIIIGNRYGYSSKDRVFVGIAQKINKSTVTLRAEYSQSFVYGRPFSSYYRGKSKTVSVYSWHLFPVSKAPNKIRTERDELKNYPNHYLAQDEGVEYIAVYKSKPQKPEDGRHWLSSDDPQYELNTEQIRRIKPNIESGKLYYIHNDGILEEVK